MEEVAYLELPKGEDGCNNDNVVRKLNKEHLSYLLNQIASESFDMSLRENYAAVPSKVNVLVEFGQFEIERDGIPKRHPTQDSSEDQNRSRCQRTFDRQLIELQALKEAKKHLSAAMTVSHHHLTRTDGEEFSKTKSQV